MLGNYWILPNFLQINKSAVIDTTHSKKIAADSVVKKETKNIKSALSDSQ